MSKTSSKVKNRYKAKAYDRIEFIVKSGIKEKVKAYAAEHGETVNGYINRLISADMGIDTFGAPGAESQDNKEM